MWQHIDEVLAAPLFLDSDGTHSNSCEPDVLQRRRALYWLLEAEWGQEWDRSLNVYNIIPGSKMCTEQQWSSRFGQVFMAVVQHNDAFLIILDFQIYESTNESRSRAYHRDIVKGCVIEALLYHCSNLEGCGEQSLVCFALPFESERLVCDILPECSGLSHV